MTHRVVGGIDSKADAAGHESFAVTLICPVCQTEEAWGCGSRRSLYEICVFDQKRICEGCGVHFSLDGESRKLVEKIAFRDAKPGDGIREIIEGWQTRVATSGRVKHKDR